MVNLVGQRLGSLLCPACFCASIIGLDQIPCSLYVGSVFASKIQIFIAFCSSLVTPTNKPTLIFYLDSQNEYIFGRISPPDPLNGSRV